MSARRQSQTIKTKYMIKNKQIKIKDTTVDKDYQGLLKELKSLLDKGLYTAYKTVDNIKVQTYWQIGERIVREELKYKDRAEYGKFLIDKLAIDLGFKKRRLYEITQFYHAFPIVRALHAQLSWYHYLELIKIKSDNQRVFYQNKTVQNSWSYRELHKQIKSQLYEKVTPEEIKAISQVTLSPVEAPEVFKDTYDFNFLQLEEGNKEKELENLIVKNVENFLKELGEGFSFTGQQVPIKIDSQTHYIDLVVYNKAIPCNILIDLKVGKISSNDIGQMNKYVGYYKRHRQYEHERDTIGLIIGQEAGNEEMQFALDKLEKQIFIAVYQTKLPSEEKIRKAVKKLS
jgi:predicted nuclease of restriction endonuclease-like (RecB) superfamily